MGNSPVKYVAIGLVAVALIVAGVVIFAPRGPRIVGPSNGGNSQVDGRDSTADERGSRDRPRRPRILSGDDDASGRTPGADPGEDGFEPEFPGGEDGAEPSAEELAGEDGAEGVAGATGGPDGVAGGAQILGPDGQPIAGRGTAPGGARSGDPTGRQVANSETGYEGGRGGLDGGTGSGTLNPDGTNADDPDGEEDEEEVEPLEGQIVVLGYVIRGDLAIDGARLALAAAGGATIFANSEDDGFYRFNPVDEGQYYLTLQDPPSPNSVRNLQLAAGDEQRQVDFIIPELPPIQGDVFDADSGDGISGATIEVLQGAGLIGTRSSDEFGHFELFPLDAGSYTVRAKTNSHESQEQTITISHADANSTVLQFNLTRRHNIAGVVLSPTGTPVGGAYVSLFSGAAYGDATAEVRSTGAGGRFEFPPAAAGLASSYRIGAYYEGYVPAYSESLTADSDAGELEIFLGAGGTLSGRIVSSDGTAIPGGEITVTAGFAQTGAIFQRMNVQFPMTTSREDGGFELKAIEPGAVTVTFAADGYVSDTREFTASEGATPLGDITLEGSDEARPDRIFGVVIDDLGNPMQNHNVYLKAASGGFERTTKTDSRGGFKADGVPPGDYIIFTNGSALRGDLFMTMDQTFPFARAGDPSQYLVYDLGQSATVRVQDLAGEPVQRFRVGVNGRFDGDSGAGGQRETIGLAWGNRLYESVNGEAVINSVLAGANDFTISVTDVGTKEIKGIIVGVGETVDLGVVVVETGVDASGTVTNASGSPLEGVLVEVVPTDGAPSNHPLYTLRPQSRTQSNGRFNFNGLPAGRVDFVFSRAGYTRERVRSVELVTGQANDLGTIALEQGAILTGSVRSETGQPLPEITITIGSQIIFTDLQGQYRADTLAPGEVQVTASDRTNVYGSDSQTVTLVAGEQSVLDFGLPRNE